MTTSVDALYAQGRAAKAASRTLAKLSTDVKNKALLNIASALATREAEVLAANEKDYRQSKQDGLNEAMLDRLLLNHNRLQGMAQDVRNVAALPDPVGESFDSRTLPNGLQISKRRVPLGVIGSVYESRPNVTVDISVLCLKAGNACILRGGKEAFHSNKALAALVKDSCKAAGIPEDAVQFVESTDRELVWELLKMKDVVDLMVPRGGADFIRFVAEHAAMPVVTGGIGVCHAYIDKSADIKKAVAIVYNAKVQRPTVCNALDCILVHRDIAEKVLPAVAREWASAGVEMHCDPKSLAILKPAGPLKLKPAVEGDWGKEYLSLTAAIKVVDDIDGALQHIEKYGSGHSEAIITEDYSAAMRFLDEVDAAVVYVNASTRFTDGGQFGLGAEVGISTQKMHARGPMGLRELTSYKWTVLGSGQVRP